MIEAVQACPGLRLVELMAHREDSLRLGEWDCFRIGLECHHTDATVRSMESGYDPGLGQGLHVQGCLSLILVREYLLRKRKTYVLLSLAADLGSVLLK